MLLMRGLTLQAVITRLAASLLGVFTGAGTVWAETAPTVQPARPPRACIEGRALPHCDLIPLFEVGWRVDPASSRMPWTLGAGFIVNVTPKWAMGATADLRLNDQFARFALRPRARLWLTPTIGLDLSPGISFPRSGPDQHAKYGAALGVSVGIRDIISLTLDADTFRDADGRQVAATVGVRVGSAITLGAFAVLGAALVQGPRPRINPKH